MPVPATIDDLSPTAGSNSPAGSEGPQEGDNYLRTHASFIALLRDKLDGTSDTGTVKNPTFSGTIDGVIDSDTYTPTLTNTTNVSSSSAVAVPWMRVGNVVTVGIQINVTPTAGSGTETQVGISLPIASDFSAARNCCGNTSGHGLTLTDEMGGMVTADVTNNRAVLQFWARSTSSYLHSGSMTYLII